MMIHKYAYIGVCHWFIICTDKLW